VSNANHLDEFKITCEFIRSFAALRFLRLTILFGATGGLIGSMMSDKIQADPKLLLLLRTAGLGVTIAFGLMDYASSTALRRVRDRANELAVILQFQTFPVISPWSPLGTEGVSRYLHLFLALVWVFALLRGWLY
jgi:hypothetical protein